MPEIDDFVIMENDYYLSYTQHFAPHEKDDFKDFLENNIGQIRNISIEHNIVTVKYNISYNSTFIDYLFYSYLYLDVKTQKSYYEFNLKINKIKTFSKNMNELKTRKPVI